MVNRLLVWAAGSPRLQRQVTDNPVTRRVAHRFVPVSGSRMRLRWRLISTPTAWAAPWTCSVRGSPIWPVRRMAVEEYEDAVGAIAARGLDATISIKLSQLGQTVDHDACVANLNHILDRAHAMNVAVEIDMEHSGLTSDTLRLFRDAVTRHPQTRLAVQAALRRTPWDLEALGPVKPRIRLVKGAYSEAVDVAHQGRSEIRAQFKFLTDWLFQHGAEPAFGTHDGELVEYARAAAARADRGQRDFEIQFLYGIRRDLQRQLVESGHRVRVYIPYGSAWYPYLTRRMAERPANLLFFLRALAGR
jgi:proline dehydrogenase